MSVDSSSSYTFWELIESYKIIIPPLQRDYAHGRENNQDIEQIRNSLVDGVYESLTQNKSLVLNFIYGEKDEDKFVPIDGQQRLTTLFLLHWYIFKRTDYIEGIERLKYFSYQTRVTSERFCENLCSAKINFDSEKVSTEIKECHWMTGNFLKDPTIKSMLIMMDTIHLRFATYSDFELLKDKLISQECPITFTWLSMDNFKKTNNLYIKMNARGKLLSDFEIFKAKLQNSELVKLILGADTTKQDIILYISRYNNQYAEFFYKIFQDAYDEAMMLFIKEMVRDYYLAYVSHCGVPQKEYRDEYTRIHGMNGSVFSRYIETRDGAFHQCKDATDAIVRGIHMATDLLDMFLKENSNLVFENTLSKSFYREIDLFVNNYQKDTLSDDVTRFATYAYLVKFGNPEDYDAKQAYCMWKRFVFNVVTNSPFKSRREDVCEAFSFFDGLLQTITHCDEKAILEAIAKIPDSKMTAAIKLQVKEEVTKAILMKDSSWKKAILGAEEYFVDGQIGFILDCCKTGTNMWNLAEFEKYKSLYRKFFDPNKKLVCSINERLFERALLCMTDSSGNHTAHLLKQPNSTTSWGFLGTDYKDFLSNGTEFQKRQILKRLLDQLSEVDDCTSELNNIIESVDENKFVNADAWKLPFINQDLFDASMGYYKFKNCINLSENRKEVLMIAGTTVRAYSMELHTFLLYRELIAQNVKGIKTVLFTTADMLDHDGFPLRYLEIEDVQIGYSYHISDVEAPYLYRTSNGIKKMKFDDVVRTVVNSK